MKGGGVQLLCWWKTNEWGHYAGLDYGIVLHRMIWYGMGWAYELRRFLFRGRREWRKEGKKEMDRRITKMRNVKKPRGPYVYSRNGKRERKDNIPSHAKWKGREKKIMDIGAPLTSRLNIRKITTFPALHRISFSNLLQPLFILQCLPPPLLNFPIRQPNPLRPQLLDEQVLIHLCIAGHNHRKHDAQTRQVPQRVNVRGRNMYR